MERRIWLPVAGMFVLLCILVWLNEIVDLPHLLLGAPRTSINWREAIIETVLIAGVGVFAVLRLIRDITERKRAEEQVLQQQRALAVMEERERMARELHDSLGQVLSYVNAQAQAALDLIEKGEAATAVAHLARLSTVAADANTDVREFILDMRATVSPEQGFFAALEQYLQQFGQTYGLPITLSRPDDAADDLLAPAAQIQLLRIIQEALFNTRKHAQAHSAQVIFTCTEDHIQVVIADDGVGFSPHPGLPQIRGRESAPTPIGKRLATSGWRSCTSGRPAWAERWRCAPRPARARR